MLFLAIVVGVLFATGVYMLLRRSFAKLILGLALLSNGANVLIFSVAKPSRGNPPLIAEHHEVLAPPYTDPLPLALILTAIVITFAILSFTLVLLRRTYEAVGADDLDGMQSTDR